MSRLHTIWSRYSWRTPFVVCSLLVLRTRTLYEVAKWDWLKLSTQGTKGKRGNWGRTITVTPGSVFNLGDALFIGDRCIFEISVNPRAQVSIGSNTWISHDCHLASAHVVVIGEHVLIGEFVSIRDSTHSHADTTMPMKSQKDILGSVRVEDDVWIGRGCLIQGRPEGVVIGRGSIIGANSVVSRSIPPMQIWGGVPARFIKSRNHQEKD